MRGSSEASEGLVKSRPLALDLAPEVAFHYLLPDTMNYACLVLVFCTAQAKTLEPPEEGRGGLLCLGKWEFAFPSSLLLDLVLWGQG